MTSRRKAQSEREHHQLNALLTWLLTAVSQQFFHMLLLGKRGQSDMVARLKVVDDTDFPNAMKIIDLLLVRGEAVSVGSHCIAPRLSTHAILDTELEFELRFAGFLRSVDMQSSEGRERLAQAWAPRDGYRAWLTEQKYHLSASPNRLGRSVEPPELFSSLLQLMEQTLLHAFAYWHEGKKAEASTAWQISGAAMLYLTTLAEFCGTDDPGTPGIEIPGSIIVMPESRFVADVQVVRRCAQAARLLASTSEDSKLQSLGQRISDDCERIGRAKNGEPIEVKMGSSEVFSDFSRARERMNR